MSAEDRIAAPVFADMLANFDTAHEFNLLLLAGHVYAPLDVPHTLRHGGSPWYVLLQSKLPSPELLYPADLVESLDKKWVYFCTHYDIPTAYFIFRRSLCVLQETERHWIDLCNENSRNNHEYFSSPLFTEPDGSFLDFSMFEKYPKVLNRRDLTTPA